MEVQPYVAMRYGSLKLKGLKNNETAQAAQALHAGTIQQQLTSGTDQSEGSGDEPKKQGWFSRLFRG